jgi:hypothetical protein
MENFLYSIAAAAITGLAFLAYKHPEAYSKIYGIITVAIVVAIAFMNGWNFAITAVHQQLLRKLPIETASSVSQSVTDTSFSVFQSFGLPMLFYVFHIFLSFLPALIEKPSDQPPKA